MWASRTHRPSAPPSRASSSHTRPSHDDLSRGFLCRSPVPEPKWCNCRPHRRPHQQCPSQKLESNPRALRRNSSRCLHEFYLRRHSPVRPQEALNEALLTTVATVAAIATHEPLCIRRDRRPILVCVVAVSTEVDDAVLRVVWKQIEELENGVQEVDGIVTEDHQSHGS